ncbi:MAG: hypothetical protein LBN39_10330 [Planctomycetaceae bacterium]|jgi:hypothetical protein|nr:hypothetical protein [Planctomycetaceae bacterium]
MKYLLTLTAVLFFTTCFVRSVCFADDAWFVDGRHADLSAVQKLDENGQWTD